VTGAVAVILSKQTIEQIRGANDIADVIGSYLHLKRAGTALKAICPFHKEKTPSFHVNPQRQIFHCFGCGAGGDVFMFIMQYENVDFVNAARLLARRAGIQVQFEEGGRPEDADAKETLYKLHEEVAQFYHRVLLEHPSARPARDYLSDRRMGKEIIAQFLLGFAPGRADALRAWAAKNKYTLAQLEAAGLVARGERGEDDVYDRFRGRLMFPIRDELGRVIAFSGRIIEKDQHPAKYVNSPETAVFRKSRVLYALDRARRPILEARTALVCEGQIDVIRCHGAGFTTAVAGLGTALTDEHARLLKRYADSVVLVMDADTAGQNSAMRTSEIFFAAGLSVRVATLPPGEDPDSLILGKGPDALREVIEAAQSALDFQIDVLRSREDVKTEAGLLRVTRAVLEAVGRVPSEVQRDQLLRQAATRLNVSEKALRADLRPSTRREAAPRDAGGERTAPPKHVVEEVEIARLLAHHPECAGLVRDFLPAAEMSDPDCRVIVQRLLDGREELVAAVAQESPECARLAAELLAQESKVMGSEAGAEAAARDLVLRIRRRSFERRRKTLEDARSRATGVDREQVSAELAQVILDIQALKQGWDKARPVLEIHSIQGS
jgi:DNA primase